MNFQDLWNKFYFTFEQSCGEKSCAFVVMGIGRKVVWAGVGWAEVIRQVVSFLLVCVCVCVCGAEPVGVIRHQMLL